MVRKIIGGICLFVAAGGLLGLVTGDTETPESTLVLVGIFLIVGLSLILKKGKSREEKLKQKERMAEHKDLMQRTMLCEHMAGLPLAQGNQCKVLFEENAILISGGGNSFRVAYEKITDLAIKTDVEIQKSYVSSIGGAVGGAVLFGPLGAMVGGRAKERTSRKVEYYFIITYNKDDTIDYVSFRVFDNLKAGKLIQRYKPMLSGKRATIDL